MRRHLHTLFFAFAFFFTSSMSGQGMKFFQGTWEEAKAEARKQNKPIFMDAYTTWCGPCKKMSADVFPKENVGAFYNDRFINYKLDMEKGEGPAVAKAFTVQFYPTYLFFDAQGALMHKSMGYKQPIDFIKAGEEALDPNQNLAGLRKKLEKGVKDTAFLFDLIIKTHELDAALQADAIKAYWAQVKDEEILRSYHPFKVFMFFEPDINSPRFNYVLKNQDLVEKNFGKQALRQAVFDKAGGQFQDAIDKLDEVRYNRIYEILMAAHDEGIRTFAEFADLIWLINKNDLVAFEKKATAYISKYPDNNEQIHHLAWAVLEMTDDKPLLQKAEAWAKMVSDKDQSFAYVQTYATLLFKNGKYKEAEPVVALAIELGKAAGEDFGASVELQNQVKAKLGK